MTDNEIIKALECCKDLKCSECPKKTNLFITDCDVQLCQEAIDLINRQKAEVENLRNIVKADLLNAKYDFKLSLSDISGIRAEAIKEFAERLILDVQRHLMPNVDDDGTVTVENAERYFISRIKEMVGDSDA